MLALAYGRPLLVPELDAFAHLSGRAIVSYSRPGSALAHVATIGSAAPAAMRASARAFAATLDWPEFAMRTQSEMESLLGLVDGVDPSGSTTTSEAIWRPYNNKHNATDTCGHACCGGGRDRMGLRDVRG
jgi:hypothetical protein